MQLKSHPPTGAAANKKSATVLKIKINGFLINYFNYLILGLSAIILIAGLFILVYPKYQQIFKANKETKNNLLAEYETKFNYLNSIRSLKELYQSINDEDKAKIDAMVPATSDTSVIINEIESIVVRNSAVLTSIKIKPPEADGSSNSMIESKGKKELPVGIFNQPPPGVDLIKIEVSLSSVNYPILKNIIKTFENNLRLFDIAKINFKVEENQALLNIYSYYLPR